MVVVVVVVVLIVEVIVVVLYDATYLILNNMNLFYVLVANIFHVATQHAVAGLGTG